jgi:hypothetical protein
VKRRDTQMATAAARRLPIFHTCFIMMEQSTDRSLALGLFDVRLQQIACACTQTSVFETAWFRIWVHYAWNNSKGQFTHETESPWPLHFKHSHRWKRRSWSKFALHYAWGTNGVSECKMDVKSTWITTWHPMDHVSWSLGLFSKTISWR